MLKKTKGYGRKREINHTRKFFVDNLKLFAQTSSFIQKQRDIIITFSKDINMNFGEQKCAYMRIEKGKMVDNSNTIVMNDLTIKPILSGGNYCYLGIDRNIAYSGPINKIRVSKEYLNRTHKILKFELSDYNEILAHNNLILPTITTTVDILDWFIKEIDDIDIKTNKILTMTGSLHPDSDVNKPYINRKESERGLN